MKLESFKDLLEYVQALENKVKLAVVCSHERNTLESIVHAKKGKLIEPLLIGEKDKISNILRDMNESPKDYTIINKNSTRDCIMAAINLVNENKADAIMKGKLDTGELMKEILNKDHKLLGENILSLVGFFEVEKYHKLLAISDIGLNTYPDTEGKKKILENAVDMIRCFGINRPKVAVLAAVEKENPKMPETVEGAQLKEMNESGIITNCIVEGPISFDLATSKSAAESKGYKSKVAGDADLLLMPDITSGNILAKCLTGFAGANTAGLVVGARVPIIITSRSAEAKDKYYSIALAALYGSKL